MNYRKNKNQYVTLVKSAFTARKHAISARNVLRLGGQRLWFQTTRLRALFPGDIVWTGS